MLLREITIDEAWTLSVTIKQDNAAANGTAVNIITANVVDSSGVPVADLSIIFEVDGNALFKDNESPILNEKTDVNGNLDVSIMNTSESDEVNTVTVFLLDEQDNKKEVEIHFHKQWEALTVASVYNKNKTFVAGEPTISWCGAEFMISTTGGSGQVSWTYDDDGSLSLSNNGNILTVKIIKSFFGERVLTCIDEMTQETLDYTFNISDVLFLVDTNVAYNDFIENKKTCAFPSLEKYQKLFFQWGKLSAFDPWPTDGEYWSSDYDQLGVWAVNTDTGNERKLDELDELPVIVQIGIDL